MNALLGKGGGGGGIDMGSMMKLNKFKNKTKHKGENKIRGADFPNNLKDKCVFVHPNLGRIIIPLCKLPLTLDGSFERLATVVGQKLFEKGERQPVDYFVGGQVEAVPEVRTDDDWTTTWTSWLNGSKLL